MWQKGRPAGDLEMTWNEGFSSRLQRKLEVRLTALGTMKEPRDPSSHGRLPGKVMGEKSWQAWG